MSTSATMSPEPHVKPKRPGGWLRKLERSEERVRALQVLVRAQQREIAAQDRVIEGLKARLDGKEK